VRAGTAPVRAELIAMPSHDNLLLFFAASVLLVLTPGPNLLYLVSRTLCQGRAAGLVSLAGTTTGFVVHILAASLGLSAVFVAVPLAYDALRWAGAAYLVWLAWDAVRPGSGGVFAPRNLPVAPPGKLYRMGLLTSILNPKVALFYVALFPQFVEPARGSVLLQSLVLGAVQIGVAVVGDTGFVFAAAGVARWLAARPLWAAAQRWIMGGVFLAIAARLALDHRR
jgi:threonine/homoserine/homoserine lactone efflux protein